MFQECALAAEVTNDRFVLSTWLVAEEVLGDLAVAASATHFPRDVVGFPQEVGGRC